MEELRKNGIRVALDAEKIISDNSIPPAEIIALGKKFITPGDLLPLLKKKEEELLAAQAEAEAAAAKAASSHRPQPASPQAGHAIVPQAAEKYPEESAAPESMQQPPKENSFSPASDFKPIAKEYDSDLKIIPALDVTGNSRTKGGVDDFVAYFRNRYERLSAMHRAYPAKYAEADLSSMGNLIGQKVRVIAMICEMRTTKNGNLMLEVEDLTGQFKIIISQNDERTWAKSKNLVRDDIISITGKVAQAFIIADDFEWPDIPIREKKKGERDLAAVYLSDLHLGSRHFLDQYFDRFVEWLEGRGANPELAGKVKYIFVAGDIADGIGIYPNQEKDLIVQDIFKQYEMFRDFAEQVPDHIELIVSPGNHDAVRRAEPMPALPDEVLSGNMTKIGSPAYVSTEGFVHLIYHGTASDSWISSLSSLSYEQPEKVMVESLKRRHLCPTFGGNAIIPERLDYMVIEKPPDIVHFGHVHKNGKALYHNTMIINSGTFQDTTDFQRKQGHVPTPAKVPIYEFMQDRLRTLDFSR